MGIISSTNLDVAISKLNTLNFVTVRQDGDLFVIKRRNMNIARVSIEKDNGIYKLNVGEFYSPNSKLFNEFECIFFRSDKSVHKLLKLNYSVRILCHYTHSNTIVKEIKGKSDIVSKTSGQYRLYCFYSGTCKRSRLF